MAAVSLNFYLLSSVRLAADVEGAVKKARAAAAVPHEA